MSMKKFNDRDLTDITSTPFGYTLSIIGGKWKMIIMFWLVEYNNLRYGELKKCIGSISDKVLNNQLKELERDGIVIRKEYPQIPPKVEYSLSKRGLSLMPILEEMCKWGENNQQENLLK
jgi:DNA-binding HxlR family transcriptional regulator